MKLLCDYFSSKGLPGFGPLFLLFATVQHIGMFFQGEAPAKSWLITMSMTQGFFEHQRNAGLPTAWSLTIEETFYLVAPLVFVILIKVNSALQDKMLTVGKLFRVISTVAGVAILLALTGELLIKLINNIGWTWEGLMLSRNHVLHTTLFGRFSEFGVGIVAAFIHRGVDLPKLIKGAIADILTLICFVAIGACMWFRSELIIYQAFPALITGVLILVLTVEKGFVSRVLSNNFLEYLGKISYGFYLIQISVMIEPLVWWTDKIGYFRLPVLMVLTNIVCAIVYQLVEVPARKQIVDKWGKSG